MKKIAIIWFPGNNCEDESKLACELAGMKADILRWNTKIDISKYDGFLLGGGWAYEDRIRAGVISAKEPIMNVIKEEANKGKIVIGICNGCQSVVESGLIPGLKDRVEMALAPNINPIVKGYYSSWVNILNVSKKNAFNNMLSKNEVIRIPVAHGEGRFTTKDKILIKKLERNNQIVFKYCDKEGKINPDFPINPNGSMANIAGICNREGNVIALMPHPERAILNYHHGGANNFEDAMNLTNAAKIFESIREWKR